MKLFLPCCAAIHALSFAAIEKLYDRPAVSLGSRAGSQAFIRFTTASVGWEILGLDGDGLGFDPLIPLSAHCATVDGTVMAYATGR